MAAGSFEFLVEPSNYFVRLVLCSTRARWRGGVALEPGKRSLSTMFRFHPSRPRNLSLPEKNVSVNIWRGAGGL